jgi:hypothetical protein
MTKKATGKITDGLAMLMEGFAELQQAVQAEFEVEDEASEEKEDEEQTAEMEAALVTEVRAAMEFVLEGEECSTEDLATMISSITDALQEIDPEVFEAEEGEEEEEVEFDDDEDFDDDDLYEDLEELEEDEEEEEEDS